VVDDEAGACSQAPSTQTPARAGTSRRALLSTALLGTVALSGCGGHRLTGAKAVKQAQPTVQHSDLTLLTALLYLERKTVAAYTAGIPLLSKPNAKTAQQLLDEELEHTGELLSLIKAAGGGKGPARPAGYQLGDPRDQAAVLTLLHDLERAQISAYLSAIAKLSPGPVRAAASTILCSDAQHIALLRAAQGLDPVPSPLVSGAE
jgi:hypothetical protein